MKFWKLQAIDVPVVTALFAIALAIAALPFLPGPAKEAEQGPQKKSEGFPFLEAIESFGTLAIAGYAIRQYGEGKKSGERQLRAYVFITNTRRVTPHGTDMVFEIETKNTGQTPAYNCKTLMSAEVASCTEDAMPDFAEGKRAVFAMGPDQPITNTWITAKHKPITKDELALIDAGTHAYFIRCRIEYTDAFKIPRHTEVVMAYSGRIIQTATLGICDHGHDIN